MYELVEEIANRQSVTHWMSEPIAKEAWDCLIEAARRAPSSWNHQPARYVIVEAEHARQKLHRALHRTNAWAEKAAALLVQFAAPEDDDQVDGKDYYLYDCGLAMMSLIYQAQAMGITARQMIGFDEAEVKKALAIPARYRVVVITGLGYLNPAPFARGLSKAKRHLSGQHKRYASQHLFFQDGYGEENEQCEPAQ